MFIAFREKLWLGVLVLRAWPPGETLLDRGDYHMIIMTSAHAGYFPFYYLLHLLLFLVILHGLRPV